MFIGDCVVAVAGAAHFFSSGTGAAGQPTVSQIFFVITFRVIETAFRHRPVAVAGVKDSAAVWIRPASGVIAVLVIENAFFTLGIAAVRAHSAASVHVNRTGNSYLTHCADFYSSALLHIQIGDLERFNIIGFENARIGNSQRTDFVSTSAAAGIIGLNNGTVGNAGRRYIQVFGVRQAGL